jgi:transcriptional regulator GlxA family with amidase domain|tara:strand:+ start:2168 stop:3136 length:969 start_codon:yes stop_codon:yes gene_type:complete
VRKIANVGFLLLPPFKLIDLVGPLQVFEDANQHINDGAKYRCHIFSECGGFCRTDTLIDVPSVPWKQPSELFDTLIVVGNSSSGNDEQEKNLIRGAVGSARRVAAVCVASIALARASLLTGRKVVTHWQNSIEMQREFPTVKVEHDAIFVNDCGLWTCGGVTSGIDMALALVAEDHGRKVALDLARTMVVYMVRPGGQSQFSIPLQFQSRQASHELEAIAEWIRDNIAEDLSVGEIAQQAKMSARTLARKFRESFDCTPARYVELCRLEKARGLLEETDLSVKEIAVLSGFLEADRLRRSFAKVLKVSPLDYRSRFGESDRM